LPSSAINSWPLVPAHVDGEFERLELVMRQNEILDDRRRLIGSVTPSKVGD
jgi:hypothetical protein